MQSTAVSLHTWVCLVVCNFVVMRVYVTRVQMVSVFFYDLHTFWRSHELHLIKQERKGEYQDIRSKGKTQRTFRTLALKQSVSSVHRKYFHGHKLLELRLTPKECFLWQWFCVSLFQVNNAKRLTVFLHCKHIKTDSISIKSQSITSAP